MPACAKEYGTPTSTYILNGKVKSSNTSKPIENIKVSGLYDDVSVFTNNTGDFSLKLSNVEIIDNLPYHFKDIDSFQNGSLRTKILLFLLKVSNSQVVVIGIWEPARKL